LYPNHTNRLYSIFYQIGSFLKIYEEVVAMKEFQKILTFICTLIFLGVLVSFVTAKEEGMVLYFKFEQVSQNQVADLSGNENHGGIFGKFEMAEGKIGKGVRIEGNNTNYVEVADADSLDLTEVYSMLVWVNFDEITGTRHQFFFDKGADDKKPGGWRVGKVMGGSLILQPFKDGKWQPSLSVAAPGFKTNQWYHVAVTRDKKGETKIYLDGEDKISSPSDAYILPINDNALIVWGSTVFGWNNMFIGVLDELAIFNNRALSASEIRNFMENRGSSVSPVGKLSTVWGRAKKVD
jgi:hypothetical protein